MSDLIAVESVPVTTKVRRRRADGATRRPVAEATKRVKVGLYLSEENARRLGLHSLMEGRDRSVIVDQLIADHLKGWVVQYRGGARDTVEDRQPDAA